MGKPRLLGAVRTAPTKADKFNMRYQRKQMALRMKRKGYTIELNPDYFRDAVGYLRAEEIEIEQPSLFDLLEQEGA